MSILYCLMRQFYDLFRDVKVIILGSAAVGKTCLLQRYLTGNFKDDTISVRSTFSADHGVHRSVVHCVSPLVH